MHRIIEYSSARACNAISDLNEWRTVWVISLLIAGFLPPVFAQEGGCGPESEFTVTVVGNNLVFQPLLPQNTGWTYAWGWEDANNNSGEELSYSFSLPTPTLPATLDIRLETTSNTDAFICTKRIFLNYNCESAGFAPDIQGCCVYFDTPPIGTLMSATWNFGDGSLPSNEIEPLHCYAQPGGTYNVSHAVVWQDPFDESLLYVDFCNDEVVVSCGGGTFAYSPMPDCCRLKICFESEAPGSQQLWSFGDGTTSSDINPCHYYTNLSTFPAPNGTPTVEVVHTIYTNGVPSSHTHTINLGAPAIYLGNPGTPTSLVNVVSSITNAPMPQLQGAALALASVFVAGELTVDKPWTCNGVKFCMHPAAGMKVTSSRSLTFGEFPFGNFPTIVNNALECEIWRSIDLEANASFTSTGATIQSALYGLRTLDANSTIRLTRTAFVNNFVGIHLRHNVALTTFDRNSFITSGFLPPLGALTVDPAIPAPYLQQRGFAGIFCRANTLNIPAIGIANPPNLFNNLANGIWTQNTNATLRRCRFTNMVAGGYGNLGGVGIRYNDATGGRFLRQWGLPNFANTFSNCRIGISVASSGPNTFVDSRNNNMNTVGIGYDFAIRGSLAHGSIVVDNDITIDGSHGIGLFVSSGMPSHLNIWNNFIEVTGIGIGIWLLDNFNTAVHDIFVHSQEPFNGGGIELGPNALAGIALHNFDGADVVNNEINMDLTSSFPRGIVLTNSDNNTVTCNIVNGGYQNPNNGDSSRGLSAVNSASNTYQDNNLFNCWNGINFDMVCAGTNLRCNQMQANNIGLWYTATSVTGWQVERGNRWLGAWAGNTGAWHDGAVDISIPTNQIQFSQFFAANANNEFPPGVPQMPNNQDPLVETWFYNGAPSNCDIQGCDDEIVQEGPDELDDQIATNGIELEGYEDVYRWLGDRYLYKKLKTWPSMASGNPQMQNYLSANANTPFAKLWDVGSQTAALYGLGGTQVGLISGNFVATKLALDSILAIDEQLAAGVQTATEASLLLDRQGWAANIDNLMASNESVWSDWMSNRANGADACATLNSGISTSGLYDDNEKTLNAIYLQTEAKGLPVLLAHKNTIRAIAEQCALDGGDAVYRARAWYAQFTGTMISEDDCISTGGRESLKDAQESVEKEELRLFPNPASQMLNVEYNAGTDQMLTFYNQFGVELRRLPLKEGGNKLTIDLKGLPDGIYLVKVQDGTAGSGISKKLVIHK